MKKQNGKPKYTVVIVGLGLMGASLALTIKKKMKNCWVMGVSRKRATLVKAKQSRVIDEWCASTKDAFQQASLIVIATPISKIASYLIQADAFAKPGTLVTDLGSTKEAIVAWARRQEFENIDYIGSHPLAGSHESGLSHAFEGLYSGATCFVSITPKINKEAVKKLVRFWQRIGTKVCLIDPAEHDDIMAATSHFPHLIAFALTQATAKGSPDALRFAGPSYKGVTRVAQSGAQMWVDIILSNKQNIMKEGKLFIRELEGLLKIVGEEKQKPLLDYLNQSRRIRSKI